MNQKINPLQKMKKAYSAIKTIPSKKAGWFKTVALTLMCVAHSSAPMSGSEKKTDGDLPGVKNNPDRFQNMTYGIEANSVCVNQLCREGAFFLDYSKYLKSKNIEKSVVYKTNMQAEAENICKEDLGYLSAMRESGGDATLVGGRYMGLYQYGEPSIHNAVLEAVCAKNSDSEVKEMCENYLLTCPPNDPGYLRAKEAAQAFYAENMAKAAQCSQAENRYRFYNAVFAKGAKARQNLVHYFKRGSLLASSFKVMSRQNPELSVRWQKSFLKTYMILCNYDNFKGKPLPVLVSAAITAGIHGGGPGKINPKLENNNELEASRKIIAVEDHPDKRIEKARRRMAVYATEEQMAEAAALMRDSSYLQAFERGKKYLMIALAREMHQQKSQEMRLLTGKMVPVSLFNTGFDSISVTSSHDTAAVQSSNLKLKSTDKALISQKNASQTAAPNKIFPVSFWLRQKANQK